MRDPLRGRIKVFRELYTGWKITPLPKMLTHFREGLQTGSG
jgi:hypothetical protein